MNHIKAHDIDSETIETVTNLFKLLGDPTRVRILNYLCIEESAVNAITDELNLAQSTVSHQLRLLKGAHLVKSRRDGRTIFYSIADNHVIKILHQAIEHVGEANEG